MLEFIGEVLIIASVIAGTVSFVGLFRRLPSLWLPTRTRAVRVWVACIVLLFVGGSLLPEPVPPTEDETERARELAVTVDEFVRRYNQSLQAMESDVRVFTRLLRGLIFIGGGTGELESGIDIMFGTAAVVMALEDPLMPPSARGDVLRALGWFEGGTGLTKEGQEVVRDNVKYTMQASDVVGITLIVDPI